VAVFLADEGFTADLSDRLVALGQTVTRARQAGLGAAKDDAYLVEAAATGAIIVTHNGKHVAELHYAWLNWPRIWNLGRTPRHSGSLSAPQIPPAERDRFVQSIGLLVSLRGHLRNELHVWDGSARVMRCDPRAGLPRVLGVCGAMTGPPAGRADNSLTGRQGGARQRYGRCVPTSLSAGVHPTTGNAAPPCVSRNHRSTRCQRPSAGCQRRSWAVHAGRR
jgi:hypothetical protein